MVLLSEKLKYEIKNELIEYYETIKFEIDIKSQQLLLIDKKNDSDVLDSYLKLIGRVECIFNQNIDEINNYFEKNVILHRKNSKLVALVRLVLAKTGSCGVIKL